MVAFLAPFFATVGAKAATFGITKAAIGQAVVGAAASAIMNKSADNRPQTTTTTSKSRTNFQEMRDDAIAAGYNPLTALRMTGAAGNVTTTGTSVINTPALSSRAILGRAIGAGLNSLGNSISSYDPLAQKQKELNIKLSEQQLSRGNLSTLPPGITPPGFKVAGSSFADRVAATPDEPNAYDPRSGWSIQVWDMADGTQPISEVTNIDGYFTIRDIPTTNYTVEASFVGYKTELKFNVVVKSGGNPELLSDARKCQRTRRDYCHGKPISKIRRNAIKYSTPFC